MRFGRLSLQLGVMCLALWAGVVQAQLGGGRASFSTAVDTVAPAVVNIFTSKRVTTGTANPMFADPFFQHFFQGFAMPMRQRVERSLGSGVVVSAEGYVITNLHVIDGAEDIQVVFNDGREYAAKFLGADKSLDLAVLKLEQPTSLSGTPFPYAQFGDAESLKVGDLVLAIGNPFGVGQSVSLGVVSAVGRSNLALSEFSNYIQTDAAINPGNSGGALVDSTGAVVGINTAIFSKSGASNGIGFATPAHVVQAVLNGLLEDGKIKRPWFGAIGQEVTAELAFSLGLQKPGGILVNELFPNGPADRAGIKIGDVVLRLADRPIGNMQALNSLLISQPQLLDMPTTAVVWRDGAQQLMQVQMDVIPVRNVEQQRILVGRHPLTNYKVEELTPAANLELDLPLNTRGVAVVGLPERQQFGQIRLKIGDIIDEIDETPIATIEDLEVALEGHRPGRPWRYKILRGEQLLRLILQ